MDDSALLWLFGLAYTALELTGMYMALHAVMTVRTSQGAVAWAISLIAMPSLAVPLYLIFGRNRFEGYVTARRAQHPQFEEMIQTLLATGKAKSVLAVHDNATLKVFEHLSEMPLTQANGVDLLIDGKATFDAIFDAIEGAEAYVAVQFFIVRDDQLGKALQERLVAKARAGLDVYFLYDEVGCHGLSGRYLQILRDGGVEVSAFNSRQGRRNRFQLNFRNHRKIVIVDGELAFLGGHNVGVEYLGRDPKRGAWRDTHIRITGPSVAAMQLVFAEDWNWATGTLPTFDWAVRRDPETDKAVMLLPTGPADDQETCGLFFTEAINAARQRLWISSPYFVPDSRIMGALHLAALRGVDVRIMLPENPDHVLVYLASFAFIPESSKTGVKFYRYQAGFLHQKVMLVDDDLAAVGTANLDNRSFRLNFELTAVVYDRPFGTRMAEMFEADFARCRLAEARDFDSKPLWFRVSVRVANLLSPIL